MNISRPTMQECVNRTLLIARVAIKGPQMTNGTINEKRNALQEGKVVAV